MNAFLMYLARVGVQTDVYINVILGGIPGMTVSKRVSIAAGWTSLGRTGRQYLVGCLMCWFLNWAVQKNHCKDQFSPKPTPWYDMLRAALAFGFGFFLLYCIIKFVINL